MLWYLYLSALVASQPALAVNASWNSPKKTDINDLDKVLDSTGANGFIYNSSHTPDKDYGNYNWCNMPHVRKREYKKAPSDYKLQYVEVIQRHHKRTPYQQNTFPEEAYPWDCDDQGLFTYGEPMHGKHSAHAYWKVLENSISPFNVTGFKGNCNFPQISEEGLEDSWQHGHDIYGVYHDLLHFLPRQLDLKKVSFRVTNNVITSQVAGMLINGMYGVKSNVPLLVESATTDSLKPDYSCPRSDALFKKAEEAPNTPWSEHLDRTKNLFSELDAISGVSESASDWHVSFDHYFDNLSARLCHAKPLPCHLEDSSKCVSQAQADAVFRLGQFEYSYIYRDAPTSLAASASGYGVWVAELAQHLRDQMAGNDGKMIYRHNVAHDGSVSRLLSILQLDVMVWPGMGSEIVFELYSKKIRSRTNYQGQEYFVRVLFGGQPMRSSHPDLDLLDMIPVSTLLHYFDGLVGEKARLVPGMCKA